MGAARRLPHLLGVGGGRRGVAPDHAQSCLKAVHTLHGSPHSCAVCHCDRYVFEPAAADKDNVLKAVRQMRGR